MQTPFDTIISQYANSPIMLGLIQSFNDAIDPSSDFEAFYNKIWNVDTAVGYGLDVWGRIVGVSRIVSVPDAPFYFGFDTVSPGDFSPFNEAPFYNSEHSQNTTTNYVLEDYVYRQLILIKAAANIYPTTVPSMNDLLRTLFADRGKAYVNDYQNMLIRYNFEFTLQPYEIALIRGGGLLPAPSGTTVLFCNEERQTVFGFDTPGQDFLPFGQGPFAQPMQDISITAPIGLE